MKKSILALSAAVAVGSLGFAGAANALAVFDSDGADATVVPLSTNNVGHYLFTPYFTTQGDNNTLVSVVNTDTTNGKAVKVRFRGAANSDDVLDFTLFLSPGDVWTASLSKGVDGLTQITSPDNSCTLPQDITNVPFRTGRLDQTLSDAALASHTREGYVEFLNMADVPPTIDGAANPLFTNIKHKSDGVAPCDLTAFGTVLNTSVVDAAGARAAGLENPSGGLTGGWVILRLSQISTFSGLHTAAVAAASIDAATGQPVAGKGNFAFAPQSGDPVSGLINPNGLPGVTADPLLTGYTLGGAGFIEPLWMDLPDMSTPLTTANFDDATMQAVQLSNALAKTRVMNEYVSTADGASVPGSTDWVVSQPTRRYQVAYDYTVSTDGRVFNPAAGAEHYSLANTQVRSRTVAGENLGKFICLRGNISATDREERGVASGVDFSPLPAPQGYCGEVFTLSFNRTSSEVLAASLTNEPVTFKIAGETPEAGWATYRPTAISPAGIPMSGFAATSLLDQANNGNYGYTFGHRW